MTQTILQVDDPRLSWDGVVDFETVVPGWSRPLRIHREHLVAAMEDPAFLRNAATSTGARVRVLTDARALIVEVLVEEVESSPLDLTIDGTLSRRAPLEAGEQQLRFDLPGREALAELWLPQHGLIAIGSLRFDGGTLVRSPPPGPVRWASYGSSITACRAADGPSETWPALVATGHNWSNLNLGFAGSCHLDDAVARTIARTPLDLVTLCIGINIYSQLTYSARSLPNAIAGFVRTVREAHPRIPIAVMSPIACPKWEGEVNAVGFTLGSMRDTLHWTVEALAGHRRDHALHLIDGRDILGDADVELLWDGLHPSADGYRTMANRLAPRLRALVTPGGEEIGAPTLHQRDQA